MSCSASALRPALSASAWAATRSSWMTETSNSFCSCICNEQSRPPSVVHHSPLPTTWISWWRVVSIFISIRTFLLSPTPLHFTSASASRTREGALSSIAAFMMRWPLPPPPEMALIRKRFFGFSLNSAVISFNTACPRSSTVMTSTRAL